MRLINTHVGFRASEPMTEDQIIHCTSINELRSRLRYIIQNPKVFSKQPTIFGMMDVPVITDEETQITHRARELSDYYVELANEHLNANANAHLIDDSDDDGPNAAEHLADDTDSESEHSEADTDREEEIRKEDMQKLLDDIRNKSHYDRIYW